MRVSCAINQFYTRLDGVLVGQRALALSGHARAESKAKGPSARARAASALMKEQVDLIITRSSERHFHATVRDASARTRAQSLRYLFIVVVAEGMHQRENTGKKTHTHTLGPNIARARVSPFVSAPKIDAGHDFSQRMCARVHGLKILWQSVGAGRCRPRIVEICARELGAHS